MAFPGPRPKRRPGTVPKPRDLRERSSGRHPHTGELHGPHHHALHDVLQNMRLPTMRTGIREVDRQLLEVGQQIDVLRNRVDVALHHAQHRIDEVVPPHIQKEAHRKGFHIVAGFAATPLFLYTGLVYGTLAGLATLLTILALEILYATHNTAIPWLTRQITSTRRPDERFSWASIMFLVAALAIIWVAPLPVALAALAMLGLGDGMSALVGKAIGRHKLWYNRDKSWEGSLAGFLAGTTGAFLLTYWYYAAVGQPYPLLAIVPICIAGSVAATIAESIPQWEDNFSVPIASSVIMIVLWYSTDLQPMHGALIEWLFFGGALPLP